MGAPKGNTNGLLTQFGRGNDPSAAQAKSVVVRKDHAARVRWFEDYTNLALELASLPADEFEKRFAHPSIKAEEILLWQFSDPKTAYSTLKDFQERVQGKPKQEKDINVTAPAGLTINVATKQEAEDLDNLL